MKIQITLYTLCFILFYGCKEKICPNEGKKSSDVLGDYVIEGCKPWYYEGKPSLGVWVIDAEKNSWYTKNDFKADQLVRIFSNESDYINNKNEIAKGITDSEGKVYFPHLEPAVYYVRSELGCRSSFGMFWGGVDLRSSAHRMVGIQLFRGSSQTIFLNNQTIDSCFAFIDKDTNALRIGPNSIHTDRRPSDTKVDITVIRNMKDTAIKTYKWTTNRPCGTDTTFFIN
jgi:hypothetical protein